MLARNRAETHDWAQERRDRTRHLIELDGLMQKAGLVEMLEDDRATMLGVLLEAVEQLQAGGPEGKEAAALRTRWRRKGMRTFEADEAKVSS